MQLDEGEMMKLLMKGEVKESCSTSSSYFLVPIGQDHLSLMHETKRELIPSDSESLDQCDWFHEQCQREQQLILRVDVLTSVHDVKPPSEGGLKNEHGQRAC